MECTDIRDGWDYGEAMIAAGDTVGDKYRIIRQIAKGGMGVVFLGQSVRDPDFKVAIKALDPELVRNTEIRERFRNEVQVGYRVSHPSIVRMFEYFDDGDHQAFAMELVEGHSLSEIIAAGPIDSGRGLRIIFQIASALQALQFEGIVHRDLKPDNILLNENFDVKITDFGISRIPGAGYQEATEVRVGTAVYVAPEYLERGDFDHRSDLYALGLLGYEMFTTELPFSSDDPKVLVVEKLRSHGEMIRELRPDLDETICSIILRLLEVDPTVRFQKAEHIILVLEPLIREAGMSASKLIAGESNRQRWLSIAGQSRGDAA